MDDDWPWIISTLVAGTGYVSVADPDGIMSIFFQLVFLILMGLTSYGAYKS